MNNTQDELKEMCYEQEKLIDLLKEAEKKELSKAQIDAFENLTKEEIIRVLENELAKIKYNEIIMKTGKYIPPSVITISQELLEDIESYEKTIEYKLLAMQPHIPKVAVVVNPGKV